MKEEGDGKKAAEGRARVTVTLPAQLHRALADFCREKKVSQDLVVERALTEYFREGDMSH